MHINLFLLLLLHWEKKWTCHFLWTPTYTVTKVSQTKLSMENNPSEEGKFSFWYWNIYPATHTVFVNSPVQEKCSFVWTGTFYRSKKAMLIPLPGIVVLFSQIFPENSRISSFLKDISGKFTREECSGRPPPPWLILEKLSKQDFLLSHRGSRLTSVYI